MHDWGRVNGEGVFYARIHWEKLTGWRVYLHSILMCAHSTCDLFVGSQHFKAEPIRKKTFFCRREKLCSADEGKSLKRHSRKPTTTNLVQGRRRSQIHKRENFRFAIFTWRVFRSHTHTRAGTRLTHTERAFNCLWHSPCSKAGAHALRNSKRKLRRGSRAEIVWSQTG